VICGHIHYATIRDEHGIRYMNCGDWVESCTALAEHVDGRFAINAGAEPQRRAAPVPRVAARAALRITWSRPMRGIPRSTGWFGR
jgi:hypothetical protein